MSISEPAFNHNGPKLTPDPTPDESALLKEDDEGQDANDPFGLGSSAQLIASLDPYEGDVEAWLNDILDDDEPVSAVEANKVRVLFLQASGKPNPFETRLRLLSLLFGGLFMDGIGPVETAVHQMDLAATDEKVRMLLGKLSGISQDTSQQLEQTIHDISRTVPRLTYDLQFMRESAASLRVSLHSIETQSAPSHSSRSFSGSSLPLLKSNSHLEEDRLLDDSSQLNEETTAVLERLTYLDKIKQGMEATLTVLKEAESWSTLELEFTSLLSEDLYLKAAERLAEASRSVSVFTHNMAEYESRRSLLVSLQNQLEASLSAALVKALREKDEEGRKSLFEIFGMIQREGEFRGYYYATRRGSVVEIWEKARLVDCESTSQEGSSNAGLGLELSDEPVDQPSRPIRFNIFLSSFYSSLLTLIAEERTVLPSIFPDPQPTLTAFIQNVFDSLNPSLAQRIELLVEFHGPSALSELITAYKSTEELALGIQSNMDKINPSLPPSTPVVSSSQSLFQTPRIQVGVHKRDVSPSPSRKPSTADHSASVSRRYSRKLTAASVSYPTGGDPQHPEFPHPGANSGGQWENPLYEPFLDFQSEYGQLERRLVNAELDKELGSTGMRGADQRDTARVVLEKSNVVFGLAEAALERCLAFTHGFGAVDLVKVVNELLDRFLKSCEELLDGHKSTKVNQKKAVTSLRGNHSEEFDELDQLDMDGMDYSSEDWGTFQLALHLIGACRGIRARLSTFETKLHLALHQVALSFVAGRDDPTGHFYTGTTKGSITLLQQSGLNSKELHDMLELLNSSSGEGITNGSKGTNGSVSLAPASHLRAPSFFPSYSMNGMSSTPSSGQANHAGTPRGRRSSLLHKHPLLGSARKSLVHFTTSSQVFLQKTVLLPLHQLLSTYPSLPVYASDSNSSSKSTTSSSTKKKATSTVGVPMFSRNPTDTIARIGEGLLNLPRLFEVYADDDAISFSLETLPFIKSETLQDLRAAHAVDQPVISVDPMISPTHLSPLSSPSSLFPPPVFSGKSPSSGSFHTTPSSTSVLPPETVVSLHLSSLTLSLLATFSQTVFTSLPALPSSPTAVEQLSTDIGYLVNVVRALDVDWFEGQAIKDGLDLTSEELRKELEMEDEEENAEKTKGEKRKVWLKVAKMRGIL